MQITVQLHNSSDLQLLLAFLRRIGAEFTLEKQQNPTVSAVSWLEVLAQQGGIQSISDPSAWQREIRQDRPLISR